MTGSLADWTREHLDIPFPGKDHDAWAVSASAAAVVDGATPLSDDWPQDLQAFSQRIADVLVHSDGTSPMKRVWARAIESLRDEFAPAGHKRSAGVAFVREAGDNLEFAALGDLKCLIGLDDRTIELFDSRLVELDRQAAQSSDPDVLKDNRALANTPQGYPIFADDPKASERLTTFTVARERVRAFALLSDGAWRCLSSQPGSALASILPSPLRDAFASTARDLGVRQTDDATILRFIRREPAGPQATVAT